MTAKLIEELKNLSPAQIAALRDKLVARRQGHGVGRGASHQQPAFVRVDRAAPYFALSFDQESLWALHQVAPARVDYNLFAALPVRSAYYQPETLREAIVAITRRHEALRTTFAQRDGAPVQLVHEARPLILALQDFSASSGLARDQALAGWLAGELATPFDMERGPLIRYVPVRVSADDHLVFCFYHHIIWDLWSMQIFLRELSELYVAKLESRPAVLPQLPIQYIDYAAWQRHHLSGARLEELLDWWQKELDPLPAPIALRTDRPRLGHPERRGGRETWTLPPQTVASLRALARREGATLPMIFLTLLAVTLVRSTGQQRLLLGSIIANRDRPELRGMIGLLINIVLYAIDVAGCISFRDYLVAVKRTHLRAMQHSALPFSKLMERLDGERDPGQSPLTRVMFNYMPFLDGESREEDEAKEDDVEAGEDSRFQWVTSQYELTFNIYEGADSLYVDAEYRTSLYLPATIRCFVGHMAAFAAAMLTDAGGAVDQVIP